MGVTNKSIIPAICFASAAVVLYRFALYFDQPSVKINRDMPTLIGEKLHGIMYDNRGRVENVITAEQISYREQAKRFDLQEAHLAHYLYKNKEQEKAEAPGQDVGRTWHLDAEHVVILTDNSATLSLSLIHI